MLSNCKPQRICIIRLSAIGDTCHALAVIRRIQDNWPEAQITWIIGKTEAALMGDIEDIEFIIFDKSKGLQAYAVVGRQLGDHRFDVALCMHASLRANLLCRKVSAPIRLGFDRKRARDFQWLFTNKRIEAKECEHALQAMMSFATEIGAQPRPVRWDIPVDNCARDFANDAAKPDGHTVVLSPCSTHRSRNYRNWRVENYIAIIEHLNERGCRVLVTGGGTDLERDYGNSLCAGGAARNLVGRTTLKQLLALIAEADLVICPDSGPAHMATAVGTPVLGLYATSNPDRTGPFASGDLTVNRYPDAALKYLGKAPDSLRWGQRVRHPAAMDLITVEDVTSKIDAFFGAR